MKSTWGGVDVGAAVRLGGIGAEGPGSGGVGDRENRRGEGFGDEVGGDKALERE